METVRLKARCVGGAELLCGMPLPCGTPRVGKDRTQRSSSGSRSSRPEPDLRPAPARSAASAPQRRPRGVRSCGKGAASPPVLCTIPPPSETCGASHTKAALPDAAHGEEGEFSFQMLLPSLKSLVLLSRVSKPQILRSVNLFARSKRAALAPCLINKFQRDNKSPLKV